jgi:O-antigen chain-terminating methyltransferase
MTTTMPRTASAAWEEIPDGYYWAFEQRMRGSTDSVEERLRAYEDLAISLRHEQQVDEDVAPRWIDLGCGQGEFCELLRVWGWDAEGVDGSSAAIEACRARGIEATLGDVLAYLESRPEDPVGGVSAIQLIEHLPRRAWVHLFEEIHRALAPGGALLLETINGQNPEAIADYFVADVTHTWPGHPETLRLMAEHAGFADVRVRFLHEDHRGRAQDVAIWAVKAAAT